MASLSFTIFYTFVNPYAIGTQKLSVASPKNMYIL